MRTLILLNRGAGTADRAAPLLESIKGRADIEVIELDRGRDSIAIARDAVARGFEQVIAAGGDGTIHKVVQGLVATKTPARLGIIPLGTGNDLARTLGIPLDPIKAFAQIERGSEQQIDLIRVESAGKVERCINVAAGGFSGQVDEVLTDEMKATWGPLAYVRGALGVLPDLTGYETTLAYDDGAWERVEALNVIVANGRTCAGGILVAPEASPTDGLLDVIVVHYSSLLDLAAVGARLLTGDYRDHPEVSARRARRVRISAKPGMWFNIDGELFSKEPLTFTIEPSALCVVGAKLDNAFC